MSVRACGAQIFQDTHVMYLTYMNFPKDTKGLTPMFAEIITLQTPIYIGSNFKHLRKF
jgi:hypothetical protein